ncbi:AAA family ATPase [Geobacillus sp. FSL W8-0466]|uniref:AAA family ATPase n=1 Tax=Geobacillus sp. FSL W8-0466 TaxID=2975350 RepID=UPI0030D808C4
MIKKSGILEMIPLKESFDEIGGLDNLKEWLFNKSRVFKNMNKAIEYGVDIPKGVLVVGMPGCGKSLNAKATAHLFRIPLLRLDMGRLMGKYVGESEANMRKAIKLAEAISPCVLWIDELEKAFAGIGNSGNTEVASRLFGHFLTWMQEKQSPTFVVATANDISNLPPELLRKGRFDEIFYVYRCNLKIYHLQLLSTVRRPNNAASQTHIWVCEAGGCSVFRHALA